MLKPITVIVIFIIKMVGYAAYDKKYLRGKNFNNTHFSVGWKWILQCIIPQKIFRINAHVPFPVSPRVKVGIPQNIEFDPDDMQMFHSMGIYFQAVGGKLIFGKGVWVAPNVGFISSNHNLQNPDKRDPGKDIIIGDKSWIGMNTMILPGVELGPHTVVGAGAVVTKSFKEGHCVIAGNPAKVIKLLE